MITVSASVKNDVLVPLLQEREIPFAEFGAGTALAMTEQTLTTANSLWPNSHELAMHVFGVEHDFQCIATIGYRDEPTEQPGFSDPERLGEFLDALFSACAIPEDEPVRFVALALRMPDFSLHAVVMEADGDFHDSVGIPMLGRYVQTSLAASDRMVEVCSGIGRRFWGRAWEAQRCHHNKRPPEGTLPIVLELHSDDEDTDD